MSAPATAKFDLFEIRPEWQIRRRKELDAEHVAQMIEFLRDGGELPPARVVKLESGALAPVDGHHTIAAYRGAGRDRVPFVIVAEGVERIPFQLGHANAGHGLTLTAEEKRDAVVTTINSPEGGDLNNTDIACWCGVSVDLVRSVRMELRGAPSAAAERRQVLAGEREAGPGTATVSERTARHRRKVAKDGERQNVGAHVLPEGARAKAAPPNVGAHDWHEPKPDEAEPDPLAPLGAEEGEPIGIERAAEMMGVSVADVEKAQALMETGDAQAIDDVDQGRRTLDEALEDARQRSATGPAWQECAAANVAVMNAISELKRKFSRELGICAGSQRIVKLLDEARGAAKANTPQACPAPHDNGHCPICDDRGFVIGDQGNVEAKLAAYRYANA